MVLFRKSKKVGPLRLTASKTGLSLSGGVPGARLSANTKGEVRRTVSAPGSGLYDTKRIGGGKSKGGGKSSPGEATGGHDVNVSITDATGGSRALLSRQQDVAYLPVVGLKDVTTAAAYAGITVSEKGWARGIRDALLMPQGEEYRVVLLIQPNDNPAVFGRGETSAKAMDVGRLGKKDVDTWRDTFAGRTIGVALYLDVTPERTPHAEARLKPEILTASIAAETSSVEAGWYEDPEGEAVYRYWDGSAWTSHVSDGGE